MPIFNSMFKGIFLSLLCLTFLSSLAQEYDYVVPDSLPKKENRSTLQLPIKSKDNNPSYVVPSYATENKTEFSEDGQSESLESIKKPNKTTVNLEIGSSVSSDFNGNTAISTYVSPHIRHQIDERMAVSVGMMMSQTYLDGWKNYSIEGQPMPNNIYSNMVYGRLDYRVSDNMLIYGTVYQNITTIPNGPLTRNMNGTGYSLGMEYKMSERSFLQIEVRQSTGYNPYVPFNNRFGFGGRPFNSFP